MAAGLFGALGAIGDLSNQAADAKQMAHDEMVRRLAQQQQQALGGLRLEETHQQILKNRADLQAAKQPVAVGTPYVSGGKTYLRMQDPITGKITETELSGHPAETDQEKAFRGMLAIGVPPELAGPAVVRKYQGKETTRAVQVPGADSPTGAWLEVRDQVTGELLWRTPTAPNRQLTGTETVTTSTDPYGNVSTRDSKRKPMLPAGTPATPGSTPTAPEAQADPFAGVHWGTPATAAPTGTPAAAPSVADVLRTAFARQQTPAAAAAAAPPPPSPATRARVAAGPGAPAGTAPRPANPAPTGQNAAGGSPVSVGPYKGLDAQGNIPENAPVNPQVREFANNLIQGGDLNKIPVKARALAESVARKYGWRGQGALTPAQQMQIHQVDSQLKTLAQDKYLKLFDSTPTRLWLAMLPLDPTDEGGISAVKDAAMRGAISQDAADFYDDLTRLRGVLGGIRSFTGANNTNATAARLLAELPKFTNTKNSRDARYKLSRLQQEVDIIKRLGYFVPDDQAPPPSARTATPAAPAAANSSHESEADRILIQAGVIPPAAQAVR